jgi:tetratricopeptide (TPR) repeat protein
VPGLALLLLALFFFLQGEPLSFLKNYSQRPFTLIQRSLTEPGIVIFYLTQIFYPAPTRLSIEHDIAISTSLFEPWTTLPGILLIFSLIALAFFQMRKNPFFSFVILFFFLNHLIESTIIGLELTFEHRNYLPSLFLFIPVAVGFKKLLDYYHQRKRSMFVILVSFMVCVLIGLGTGTYIRNFAWATEKSLWEDAIDKAPGMARPYHNLAWSYYQRIGKYDKALELYTKALSLKEHKRFGKPLALNNIASIYYLRKEYLKASELWATAVNLYPKYIPYQYRLAKVLTDLGDAERAFPIVDKIISNRPDESRYLKLKGSLLLKQSRFEDALDYFTKCQKLNPSDTEAVVSIGFCLRLLQKHHHAERWFKLANVRNPRNPTILLWLIETNLVTNDKAEADYYMEKLFAASHFNLLTASINKLRDDNLMPLTSRQVLVQEIAENLKKDSETIARIQ